MLAVGEPDMGRVHLLSLASPFNNPVAPTPSPTPTPAPTPLPSTAVRNPIDDGAEECTDSIGGQAAVQFTPTQMVVSLTFNLRLSASAAAGFDCSSSVRFADILLDAAFGTAAPDAKVFFRVGAAARRAQAGSGREARTLQGQQQQAYVTTVLAVDDEADAADAYQRAASVVQNGQVASAVAADTVLAAQVD